MDSCVPAMGFELNIAQRILRIKGWPGNETGD